MPFIHKINPTIVDFGPIEIRWYGFFWFISILFAYFYGRKEIVKKGILNENEFDSLFLTCTIFLVLGARLGYVLIYNLKYYLANPLETFAIWKGGLSFFGGAAGLILSGAIWCLANKKSFLKLADIFTIPAAIANGLVRIGNFINSELYGSVTALPWAVNFLDERDQFGNLVFRHPSQLYEASYNLIILAAMLFLKQKNLKPGIMIGVWLMLYAIFRSLVEFIRIPDYMVGPLTIGQFLSIPTFALGLFLVFKALKAKD